jgi:hypothetical protein
MEFKALQFPFTKNGFLHELVAREGLICLVRRTRIYPDGERGPLHFEVVKLRQSAERILPNGTLLPAAEAYPSSESWGENGWTYKSEASALHKYRLLVRRLDPGAFSVRRAA